jgi:hypothetical protein
VEAGPLGAVEKDPPCFRRRVEKSDKKPSRTMRRLSDEMSVGRAEGSKTSASGSWKIGMKSKFARMLSRRGTATKPGISDLVSTCFEA